MGSKLGTERQTWHILSVETFPNKPSDLRAYPALTAEVGKVGRDHWQGRVLGTQREG